MTQKKTEPHLAAIPRDVLAALAQGTVWLSETRLLLAICHQGWVEQSTSRSWCGPLKDLATFMGVRLSTVDNLVRTAEKHSLLAVHPPAETHRKFTVYEVLPADQWRT
jgi:hypothetical protein